MRSTRHPFPRSVDDLVNGELFPNGDFHFVREVGTKISRLGVKQRLPLLRFQAGTKAKSDAPQRRPIFLSFLEPGDGSTNSGHTDVLLASKGLSDLAECLDQGVNLGPEFDRLDVADEVLFRQENQSK